MTEKEQKIFNYGVLVGELGTIAEFNVKTNHCYEFDLERTPKVSDLQSAISIRIQNITDSFELIKIDTENAFKYFCEILKSKWFFEYQNKEEAHLIDPGVDFSMLYPDYQEKYVVGFVDFLLQTLNPISIYEIKYGHLKSYYASDFDHYIFECEDANYYFTLTVTD